MQNFDVGMTKEMYLDMCEQLGNEPIEEEIPLDIEDFPPEVQDAIQLYYRLKDTWDGMSGTYLGKNYSGIVDLMNVYEIEHANRRYILDWISVLDAARSKIIAAKQKASAK